MSVFRRNHEAGRQRLMETLSGEDSTIAPYRSFSLPGRMTGKLALAATVLAAIDAGLLFLAR